LQGEKKMKNEEKSRERLIKELAECRKAVKEKEHIVSELRKALSDAVRVSGLLPVCSRCKRVRDDKEYWDRVNAYIKERSAGEETLNVCPECLKKLSAGKEKK
jgi:hypothetical protein